MGLRVWRMQNGVWGTGNGVWGTTHLHTVTEELSPDGDLERDVMTTEKSKFKLPPVECVWMSRNMGTNTMSILIKPSRGTEHVSC